MNKRRLLKLADLLEADAKNKKGVKFDLGDWGYSRAGAADHSCGTTACAMGLAVVSGAFKRAGLTNLHGGGSRMITPCFQGRIGFDAAELLFGISNSDSSFLFSAENYPTDKRDHAVGERYVAKRIRDFVAGKVAS